MSILLINIFSPRSNTLLYVVSSEILYILFEKYISFCIETDTNDSNKCYEYYELVPLFDSTNKENIINLINVIQNQINSSFYGPLWNQIIKNIEKEIKTFADANKNDNNLINIEKINNFGE